MNIYFDRYDQGYVVSEKKIKSSDRFYEIICNKDEKDEYVFVERWALENGNYIDVRYDISTSNIKDIQDLRDSKAQEVNDKLSYIISIKVPSTRYGHIERFMVKRLNLK